MRYLIKGILGCFVLLIISGFQGGDDEFAIKRPVAPWVFRSDLDQRPNILTLALNEAMWVAYDPATCGLYRAWKGNILFRGLAYSEELEKFPETDGFAMFEDLTHENPWRVVQNGKEITPEIRFGGYAIQDDKATIYYSLILPDKSSIQIEEYPEYYPDKKTDNLMDLKRVFKSSPLPEGTTVLLNLSFESLVGKGDLKTDGKIVNGSKSKRFFDWGSTYDFTGALQLNSEEPTTLTTTFTMNAEARQKAKN